MMIGRKSRASGMGWIALVMTPDGVFFFVSFLVITAFLIIPGVLME